ncbi:MAG: succinyldiaminopimelate transaminase [Methylicorpusculum sp.]|uniref:succinyldiaminopimelate transaminase n=1 Tax=Methylicorpusculum sp. TaxID=2713644 RepID=UPI00271EA20B|nr:succinyldiaminopimelate transaminase [Methylicorpusculum sp.]MDO8939574.1 succinyldiaminopimelate transaminase [Methylicorpusculum sp.]MDO9241331.1 succinyldiaminopimelate transaminase [Methylicorpusculum sp.]MDP2201859.1 succinyldiaminopimelate transaminase [Methylicorpusculum sp.]
MNPHLASLHPYPFEKLAQLKQGITPPADLRPITLSIGEPAHSTPQCLQQALLTHLQGLANYPTTKGIPELRQSIAQWLSLRFKIPLDVINPDTHILPVNGTREALFSFAQCVIDPASKALVLMPNPFYQIYEGAALLAGAEPYFLNTTEASGYIPDFESVPETVWQRCGLIYICSPGNPTGELIGQQDLIKLIELAEKYDFIIASDECYTELYNDENTPPVGLLETAFAIGNTAFKRCVVFHSLSKRSNAPGLRSGFVAGDAEILKQYFQYRTYHGCAMSLPAQHASIAAWQDESHVQENRQLYREKFDAVIDILNTVTPAIRPPAGFYVWLKTPIPDTDFAQLLYKTENVTVLPGTYLSREFNGVNPGSHHVRIALVAPFDECVDAANRIKHFVNSLTI